MAFQTRIVPGPVKRWVKQGLGLAGLQLTRLHSRPDFVGIQATLLPANPRVIFDVGANVGDVTQRYRSLYPTARVYAFEPTPALVAGLKARFADQPATSVVAAAVADAAGTRELHINNLDATSSLFARALGHRYYPKASREVSVCSVPAIALDEFCAREGIEAIDLLKMDIQGGELDALRGAQRLLEGHKIDVIVSEAMFVPHYEGAPLAWQQWALLAGHGYTLFGYFDQVWASNGQMRFGDAIFLSPAARARLDASTTEEV